MTDQATAITATLAAFGFAGETAPEASPDGATVYHWRRVEPDPDQVPDLAAALFGLLGDGLRVVPVGDGLVLQVRPEIGPGAAPGLDAPPGDPLAAVPSTLALDALQVWGLYDRGGLTGAAADLLDQAGAALGAGDFGAAAKVPRLAFVTAYESLDWAGAAAALFVTGIAGNRAALAAALDVLARDWTARGRYNLALVYHSLGLLSETPAALVYFERARMILARCDGWLYYSCQRVDRLAGMVRAALRWEVVECSEH